MSLTELTQKHARERQELSQKQASERSALQQRIERLRWEMATATTSLERRSKELELDRLQQEFTQLTASHAEALRRLEHRQAEELAEAQLALKARLDFESAAQSVKPMVKELLQEVAKIKRLQPSKITNVVEYEDEIGWLFKRKVVRYKNVDENIITPEVVEDSPGNWSIGGKIPNGCTVIYTVRLQGTNPHYYFSVEARSDASYEAATSRPIGRNEMRGPTTRTRDLSREALMDALIYVMSEVEEVCPCSTYPCPCPCACVSYCEYDCGPGADY